MSIDTPPYATVFLKVIPSICICVGTVSELSPILPNVCAPVSSVIATALFPEFLIIVLSGPSQTKCA